ncbi:sensor histidine kinase [uncultured Tenacibaculum sp.]|uniref:sensor histidine kinase n=1 Tax=uncultured Tenacibaculum sp. TaxID=174713 RepID=UPI0026202BA3|nr:histidine kinase [uncultured Tenacibaculum sp.]
MNTKLNKSDWILLALLYGATTILNGIDYYRSENKLIEYIIDLPLNTVSSIILILIFLYFIIPRYLINTKKYTTFFFVSLVVLTTIGCLDRLVGFVTAGRSWSDFPNFLLFLQAGLYDATDMIGFPLGILLIKKFYEGQTQFLKVEKQQKENELKLLRSQIDPHFLFNNLNTLDSLIDTDSEKAKEYINRLSLIYRYLIQTKDSEVMELSKEIQFAENYIFLIKTRFEYDYDFEVIKNVSLKDSFIPTGAIQTLLENVVKHNKPGGQQPIRASITIDKNRLTVVNTKSNFKVKNDSLGTGLDNLKTRYQLLSDQEITIINTDHNFKVSIPIIKLSE